MIIRKTLTGLAVVGTLLGTTAQAATVDARTASNVAENEEFFGDFGTFGIILLIVILGGVAAFALGDDDDIPDTTPVS
ncbi:hypothetical protein [Paraurantiacibacter namhicola]|uniref:Uncharacterized protein n=1 Tax=Paraurantiacibacter namhicola TaxID=645517 RepID=A0A1C7D918_9SPHN|nr:hypothetical protein [Paraurantiacibacter namhicola]ANU07937.1 hypothetical protein A6F65_01638 [Paraurantiacibacter namhicola]